MYVYVCMCVSVSECVYMCCGKMKKKLNDLLQGINDYLEQP